MSKIIYIPLEELPQRYTGMMNNAVKPLVDIVVDAKVEIDKEIKQGQFLDIINTNKFKASQLIEIANLFSEGKVQDGDMFLVGDIFFPGIEMIRYMSDLLGIDIKVFGINYAGRADSTDFVQQLGQWADLSEHGYHMICDGIFVGSEDHKRNVEDYFSLHPSTVHATGLVWDLSYMKSFKDQIGEVEKEDFVIWPHRFAPEKGIDELIQFANATDKKIVITSSGPKKDLGELPANIEYRYGLTKLEYFELMAKARWYLSTAYQETFGYTIQEAIYFNCNILVPDRACCPEMVPLECVYTDVEEIDSLFDTDLTVDPVWTQRWDGNAKTMIDIMKTHSYGS